MSFVLKKDKRCRRRRSRRAADRREPTGAETEGPGRTRKRRAQVLSRLQSDRLYRQLWVGSTRIAQQEDPRTGRRAKAGRSERRPQDAIRTYQAGYAVPDLRYTRASARELLVNVPYVALDLKIPSDIKQIERVVETVAETCRALQLPSRYCSLNIPVALSEALSNAILRGNREDHVQVGAATDTSVGQRPHLRNLGRRTWLRFTDKHARSNRAG